MGPWIRLSLGVLSVGALCAFQLPFREYPGMEYSDFPLPPNYHEQTEFVLARLMYPPHPLGMFGMGWGDWRHGRTSWTHDYPRADRHFVSAVRRLTRVTVRPVEQPVNLDDADDVYNWPFLYEEGGAMALTESQISKLRDYLDRGGILVLDDSWGSRQSQLLDEALHRILRGARWARSLAPIPCFTPCSIWITGDRFRANGRCGAVLT